MASTAVIHWEMCVINTKLSSVKGLDEWIRTRQFVLVHACVCVPVCVSLTFTLISTRLWENFSITLSIHMRGFTCQMKRASGQGQRGERRAGRLHDGTHHQSDMAIRAQREFKRENKGENTFTVAHFAVGWNTKCGLCPKCASKAQF